MKRFTNLFCILFLVFISNPILNAQSDKGGKIGIRAGYHNSGLFIDGKRIGGSDPLSSYYIGIAKESKIVPLLSLGTGVEYFRNGVKSSDSDNKWTLHYISIPVDLKVKLGPVFALGGIAPSFKVSEKLIIDGKKETPGEDEKLNIFDAPVFVGLGLQFTIIRIEARYHWGLVDLSDGYKNQYLQIGGAILF